MKRSSSEKSDDLKESGVASFERHKETASFLALEISLCLPLQSVFMASQSLVDMWELSQASVYFTMSSAVTLTADCLLMYRSSMKKGIAKSPKVMTDPDICKDPNI